MNISSSQYFSKYIGQNTATAVHASINQTQGLSATSSSNYVNGKVKYKEGAYTNFSSKAQELYLRYIQEHGEAVQSDVLLSYK